MEDYGGNVERALVPMRHGSHLELEEASIIALWFLIFFFCSFPFFAPKVNSAEGGLDKAPESCYSTQVALNLFGWSSNLVIYHSHLLVLRDSLSGNVSELPERARL